MTDFTDDFLSDFTGCPCCRSDDYIELDDIQLSFLGYEISELPVYRCEECGELWS